MHRGFLHDTATVILTVSASALGSANAHPLTPPPPSEPDEAALAPRVTAHYVELAHERYTDSLEGARRLSEAVRELLREPGPETFEATRSAWLTAHLVYSHTEVFRFGNPNVDVWEGNVNAWPMDEGLIDYVAPGYVYHEGNPNALDDIVGSEGFAINDDLIAEYQSGADPKAAPVTTISDVESNVTRGYHALEFLLWGQDLNVEPASPGRRPWTDYAEEDDCTGGHCVRRREYLSAATRLLMRDLRWMALDWQHDGAGYARLFAGLPHEEQLERMIVGMGSLGFAELASERMQVALITGDQEEEQSCFSDTTHRAILHNARSIRTTYLGIHERLDGEVVEGPSLSDLVAVLDRDLDDTLRRQLARSEALAADLAQAGDGGEPFDVMIRPDNEAGHARIRALIAALQEQTETLEKIRALVPELAKL